MGIQTDSRGIRAQTREAMRGAMSAAAHAIVGMRWAIIRDVPEQCRDKESESDTPTENVRIRGQRSGTQLGVASVGCGVAVPAETLAMKNNMITDGTASTVGDKTSPYPTKSHQPRKARIDSDMVDRRSTMVDRRSTSRPWSTIS